ncbi:hypothetical protein [Mycobacterium uberis]|uniref:hypothetical protein n=1 Tax=Mycobacterium uberis TaxID=2162698 RepID=UPI001401EE85|nr:hypothetical protein [Mycobacterium uberis]
MTLAHIILGGLAALVGDIRSAPLEVEDNVGQRTKRGLAGASQPPTRPPRYGRRIQPTSRS